MAWRGVAEWRGGVEADGDEGDLFVGYSAHAHQIQYNFPPHSSFRVLELRNIPLYFFLISLSFSFFFPLSFFLFQS